jgi:hypothetical protein
LVLLVGWLVGWVMLGYVGLGGWLVGLGYVGLGWVVGWLGWVMLGWVVGWLSWVMLGWVGWLVVVVGLVVGSRKYKI